MGINKVQYGNTTLIDLTADTVTADKLMQGYTAHDRSGALITGTATGGSGDGYVWQDENGYVHLSDEQGTSVTVEALSVTQNGTYTAPTGKAYSPVTVNVSGGGGDTWSWMGRNPTKLRTVANEKIYLKDTNYSSWTPSTSQGTILASSSIANNVLDMSYDCVILGKIHIHHEYDTSATDKSKVEDFYWRGYVDYTSYSSTLANLTSNIRNSMGMGNMVYKTGTIYRNSSGVESYATMLSYGVYAGSWNIVGNSSINQGVVTFSINTPTIYARCNGSYFSTTNASAVDQDASYIEYVMETWRVDGMTSNTGMEWGTIRDMWANGF